MSIKCLGCDRRGKGRLLPRARCASAPLLRTLPPAALNCIERAVGWPHIRRATASAPDISISVSALLIRTANVRNRSSIMKLVTC